MKKNKKCKLCNKEFYAKGNMKICSNCKENHKTKCAYCSVLFLSFSRYSLSQLMNENYNFYCSKGCVSKAKSEKNKQATKKTKNLICKKCEAEYIGTTYSRLCKKCTEYTICRICDKEYKKENAYKRYCSEECFKKSVKLARKRGQKTRLKNGHTLSPFENKEIREKTRNTFLDKYGVDNPWKAEEVKQKIKEISLEKYGTENPAQSKEVKNKIKQTNLERYGVECIFSSPEFRQKIAETIKEKYGHPIPAKNEQLLIDTGSKKVSNQDFIDYLDNFRKQNGRKPTLKDCQLEFGYASPITLGDRARDLAVINKIEIRDSYLELQIKDFLDENNIKYIRRDKSLIKPLEVDFLLPEYNVAIEVNDFVSHNTTWSPWGNPKRRDYHFNKFKLCREVGYRLLTIWENWITDKNKFEIVKSTILHACNKSPNKVYARDTKVRVFKNTDLKEFFNKNNISGFRGASKAYALVHRQTREVLMAYSFGKSYLGKAKYDAEIIRGASKLGYTIVGGASKLWKYIIKDNPEINSIVYYVNLNLYSGTSMQFLNNLELVSEKPSFKNYFLDENILKNRNPCKHKEIVKLTKTKKVYEVWDAGVQVNVWKRI